MSVQERRKQRAAGLAIVLVAAVGSWAHGAAFTAGDLAVFDASSTAAPGNTGSTINILELSPTSLQATPVQTLTAPSLYASATASSNGLLRLSDNGTEIAFTGHTALPTGTANVNTVTSRGVGVFDGTGTYSLATTYTGASGNQPRSAVTSDGTNFYVGDQGGIYRNGATTTSNSTNIRDLQIFGGNTYAAGASTIFAVTPASPASTGAVTETALTVATGSTALSNVNDFIFVSSTGGATPDTLYVSTTSSTSSIVKYAVSGTTLTSEGAFAVTGGAYGITAAKIGSAFDLFYTTGSGGAGANSVASVIDGGLAGTGSFGSATTLFTASADDVLKGIDFVPTAAAPEPTSLLLAGFAAAPLVMHRRRRRA